MGLTKENLPYSWCSGKLVYELGFVSAVLCYLLLLSVSDSLSQAGQYQKPPLMHQSSRASFSRQANTSREESQFTRSGLYQIPESRIDNRRRFDYDAGDVMVHIHIQKTGGSTLGRHLQRIARCVEYGTNATEIDRCKKWSPLTRESGWFIGRLGVQHKWPCGVHPTYSDLQRCDKGTILQIVNRRKKRYIYMTHLREPVSRLLSEWNFISNYRDKKSWPRDGLLCNDPLQKNLKTRNCVHNNGRPIRWEDLSMKDFYECHNSYAINRQIVMLADLKKVGCPPFGGYTEYMNTFNATKMRWQRLLESAKQRLLGLDYFGLTEYQNWSQDLFAFTFGLKFASGSKQVYATKANDRLSQLNQDQVTKLGRLAYYENELYKFAKELFLRRVALMHQIKSASES